MAQSILRRCARIALLAATAGVLAAGSAAAKEAGVAAAVNNDSLTQPPLQEKRTLVVGHNVVFDERIETGELGQAQLLMLDQSAVTVAPNSNLVIDKFVYDPETKSGEMALNLSRGLMRFVGGRLSKNNAVTVRTPVATMGIRGGIAIFRVISETVVEVVMVYGDGIDGVTDSGVDFSMRRHGYFTRIEAGQPPSPPQPIDGSAINNFLAQLQGRPTATAGAPDRPTQEAAARIIGNIVPSTNQSQPTNNGTNAGNEDEEEDNEAQNVVNTTQPAEDDRTEIGGELNNPDEGVFQQQNDPLGFGFAFNTIYPVQGGRRGDDAYDIDAEILVVFDQDALQMNGLSGMFTGDGSGQGAGGSVDPNDFEVGDVLYVVTGDSGQSLATTFDFGNSPLQFSLDGVGDPDAVPNVFDASDTTLYQSAETFNQNAQADLGSARANIFAASDVSNELYFNTDLSSEDFDGVNGSRISLYGGVGIFPAQVNALSAGEQLMLFEPNGDTQNISHLPFSYIGAAQLPGGGVGADAVSVISPLNTVESPVFVDWASGKLLYVGMVEQDLRHDAGGGLGGGQGGGGGGTQITPFIYGIQAVVGNISQPTDGAPIEFVGGAVGSSHFERNGDEFRTFHAGESVSKVVGNINTGGDAAIFMEGDSAVLTPMDQNGVRQDPFERNHHQFGERITADIAGTNETGTVVETLYAANFFYTEDGEFERQATEQADTGQLIIDRDNNEIIAEFVVEDENGQVVSVQTDPNSSAYINRQFFGIAESAHQNDAFQQGDATALVAVSGSAVTVIGDRPCACEFMHWGFWAAGENLPGEASNGVTDVGTFFSGEPTPDVDMPVSGSANFSGGAYASMMRPGDATPTIARGDFNMSVQFAQGVSAGQMNLGPENFAIVGSHTPGEAALSVDYFQNAQNVGNGVGSFFGTAAQNVGATINIDNGAGLTAVGHVMGDQ